MTTFFFPSCKAKADYPAASEQLREYIRRRVGVDPAGCCRPGRKLPGAEDTALVVCNNCAAILEESSAAGDIRFVWDHIDRDADFPFPDYGGEAVTIQDCWIAVEKRGVQETVRSLLAKMNIRIVELADNFEKTRFCGVNLLSPCNPSNAKLAPKRYVQNGSHMFRPCGPDEQTAIFRAHCEQITTERVACYCKFCTDAIRMGGKRGVHLLELLFPAR